ncbi:hypothetical protein [Shinella zoogloeoides]|uniref:hypothetical protein n=1 Tax=Shinella zoogloeoides TaxID=352475 RepID=UPI00273DE14A|nr:hypothetical protein [Shinella zoogloeoides]WLR90949.1 hypothetical protein Q9316_00805 [Shinella zoogloeoides]
MTTTENTEPLRVQSQEPAIILPKQASSEAALLTKNAWWHWEFDSWAPDHRHWVAPSSLTIYDDATVRMKAAHLASMWRWPIVDDGPAFDYSFEVELFYQDVHFVTLSFHLIRLAYRKSVDNFDVTNSYPHLFKYLDKATKARPSRVITKEPPRDDVIKVPIPVPGNPNDPDWPWGS